MQKYFARPFPTWLSQNEIQKRIRQQFLSAILQCFPATNHRALHRGIGQLTIMKSEITQSQLKQLTESRGLPININTKYPINLHPFNEPMPRHPSRNKVIKVSNQFSTPMRKQQVSIKQIINNPSSTSAQIQQLSSQISMLHQMITSLAYKVNTPTKPSNQTQQSREKQIRISEEELQTKAAQLQNREEELQFRATQLQIREEELQSKSVQLQTCETELQSTSTQLQTRQNELQVKTAQLQKREANPIKICSNSDPREPTSSPQR